MQKSKWFGINLNRKQLSVNFLDRGVPRNLRQVLAQVQTFRAAFERARAIRPNGFTMDAQGNVRDYARGYAVGVSRYVDIDDLIASNQNVLACGDTSTLHFGYWKNPTTGETFIDSVEIIDYQNAALEKAYQTGQIAIYDFAAKADIYLSDFERVHAANNTRTTFFVPRRVADTE